MTGIANTKDISGETVLTLTHIEDLAALDMVLCYVEQHVGATPIETTLLRKSCDIAAKKWCFILKQDAKKNSISFYFSNVNKLKIYVQ